MLEETIHRQYRIANMCCPTEERLIRNRLQGMAGVERLDFNLMSRVLGVHHRLDSDAPVLCALKAIGMEAQPLHADAAPDGPRAPSAGRAAARLALAVSGMAACAAEGLTWAGHPGASVPVAVLAALSIVTGGVPTLRKGWIALRSATLNIHFLMSLAVIGAVAIGQWPEAAMVCFLFAVAEKIEAMSLDRARNAVHALLRIAPDSATIRTQDGGWETVRADQVGAGAVVRVKPGERVALDGVVEDGESAVDQAPITGESMPAAKRRGDAVYAGTINGHGVLDVRVTAPSAGSTLSRIVRVIEEAQGRQAPTQRLIDRFARWYTPAVVLAAAAVALVPPLALGLSAAEWVYKALVLLVIACPCALVISTPVTVVSGLAAAARHGILVKGGEFLETGWRLRAIALDKTGTLTQGRPVVTEVEPFGTARAPDVLLLAASLDAHSAHPLARALRAALPNGRMLRHVRGLVALPGRGVQGDIGGKTWYLGNQRLLGECGVESAAATAAIARLEEQGRTVVALFTADEVAGIIAMADILRPETAHAVAELAAQGIHTVMLTGDNARTAEAIAREAGIGDVRAGLLPAEKLDDIERLQAAFGAVGMAGDGINDAPALARAHIGFAMGAAGSDVAIETADVALMDDDLRKLPAFVRLSRATQRVLVQNIAAALAIKALFFALALGGVATLWMAVFADVGASLLVIGNGLRLLTMSVDGRACAVRAQTGAPPAALRG